MDPQFRHLGTGERLMAYGCFSFATGVAWGLVPALFCGETGQQFLSWLIAFGLAGMTVGFLALPLLGGTSIWRLCLLAVPVCFLAMVALGLIAIIGRLLGAFSPEIAAASWLGIPYLLMGMVWFAPTYLVFLLAALNLRGCRTMARRLGLLRA